MKTVLVGIALTLLSVAKLAGQSPSIGLSLGLAKPGGSMSPQSDTALMIGLQSRVSWVGGHALVPRFDILTVSSSTNGFQMQRSLLFAGSDYNYFPSLVTGAGFYISTGLGLVHVQNDSTTSVWDYEGPGHISNNGSTYNTIYLALGFGYKIDKHLDLSFRAQGFSDNGQNGSYATSSQINSNDSTGAVFTVGLGFYF